LFEILLETSFSFLSEEYLRLFERSWATAFQHPLWLDYLYRRLAPQMNAEPVVIVVRWRDSGQLAMVLPLVRRRHGVLRVIEFADLEVSDYATPVCNSEVFAQIAGERQACADIRDLLKPYDLIRLKKICEDAPSLERLFGGAKRSRMDLSAYAVRLYEPFEQWQADNIAPSYHKELAKKRRQLNRSGVVQFECLQDPEAIKSTFHSMREYRKERFNGGDLLQQPLYFDFYVDMALHGRESGFCRTYRVTVDGQPIGGVWGLHHRRRFLVLLGGFDFSSHKNRSIGSLTFEDVARDCLERQDLVLDFTIGDESYKTLFGAQPSSVWSISAAATPLGGLAGLVAERAPWAKKFVRVS
jgi:CelD/BcsL family acetyltransferase involved in cellulose biosynthesis